LVRRARAKGSKSSSGDAVGGDAGEGAAFVIVVVPAFLMSSSLVVGVNRGDAFADVVVAVVLGTAL